MSQWTHSNACEKFKIHLEFRCWGRWLLRQCAAQRCGRAAMHERNFWGANGGFYHVPQCFAFCNALSCSVLLFQGLISFYIFFTATPTQTRS